MTVGKEAMGEQPIFTCKAHVFHIDPKTKRSWMSASTAAVNVSFFYDSSRNLYRIISVEGSKAVINSTITPNMTFTKTSQKFGQWSDVRANTVYGLGFASENELGKFIEKFQEVKEAIQAQQANSGGSNSTRANGSVAATPVASATASPLLVGRGGGALTPGTTDEVPAPQIGKPDADEQMTHQRAHSVSSMLQSAPKPTDVPAPSKVPSSGYATVGRSPRQPLSSCGAPALNIEGINPPEGGNTEQQLRYENDRLKLALAQSSANAKKWEVELATLKSNNLRLTAALQESTSNVEEWKRQLAVYREEVTRAKAGPIQGDTSSESDLRRELSDLRQRMEHLQVELTAKNVELCSMRNGGSNTELHGELKMAQSQLEVALSAHDGQRKVVQALNDQLASQLQDLATIHREINTALQT